MVAVNPLAQSLVPPEEGFSNKSSVDTFGAMATPYGNPMWTDGTPSVLNKDWQYFLEGYQPDDDYIRQPPEESFWQEALRTVTPDNYIDLAVRRVKMLEEAQGRPVTTSQAISITNAFRQLAGLEPSNLVARMGRAEPDVPHKTDTTTNPFVQVALGFQDTINSGGNILTRIADDINNRLPETGKLLSTIQIVGGAIIVGGLVFFLGKAR